MERKTEEEKGTANQKNPANEGGRREVASWLRHEGGEHAGLKEECARDVSERMGTWATLLGKKMSEGDGPFTQAFMAQP